MRSTSKLPRFEKHDNPFRSITFHSCNNSFSVTVGNTRYCSSLTEAMQVRDEMEGQSK
jgi:hypothetical protein